MRQIILRANEFHDEKALDVAKRIGRALGENIVELRRYYQFGDVVLSGGSMSGYFGDTVEQSAVEVLQKAALEYPIILHGKNADTTFYNSYGAARYLFSEMVE